MADEMLSSAPSSTDGTPDPRYSMSLRDCQEIIFKSYAHPKVKELIGNMQKSGCSVGTNFIRAVNCRGRYAGGFSRGNGIVICANHLRFRDEVVQTMIHELIHAYDDCRAANLNWSIPAHQACSEIRANHLSGDCHWKREILRGRIQWDEMKGHEPICVKRRSVQSVAANHKPGTAKTAVEAVWDTCYNDIAPFNRVLP